MEVVSFITGALVGIGITAVGAVIVAEVIRIWRYKRDTIILRDLPLSEAKGIIDDYIGENHGIKTSEIVLNLGINPIIVHSALEELVAEDKIHPIPIEEDENG